MWIETLHTPSPEVTRLCCQIKIEILNKSNLNMSIEILNKIKTLIVGISRKHCWWSFYCSTSRLNLHFRVCFSHYRVPRFDFGWPLMSFNRGRIGGGGDLGWNFRSGEEEVVAGDRADSDPPVMVAGVQIRVSSRGAIGGFGGFK